MDAHDASLVENKVEMEELIQERREQFMSYVIEILNASQELNDAKQGEIDPKKRYDEGNTVQYLYELDLLLNSADSPIQRSLQIDQKDVSVNVDEMIESVGQVQGVEELLRHNQILDQQNQELNEYQQYLNKLQDKLSSIQQQGRIIEE